MPPFGKIVENREAGIDQINTWRLQGLRVALTPGMYDLPTEKHPEYFRTIANHGVDKVVVGIDTDEFVAQRKDPRGPIRPWQLRAEHSAHYPYVDLIIPKAEPEPEWLRWGLRPNILVLSSTSFPDMRKQRIDPMLPYLQSIGTELVLFDENNRPIVDTHGNPSIYNWTRC